MLVLVETAAGYGLFTVQSKKLIDDPEKINEAFSTAAGAQKAVKLHAWSGFKDNKQAMDAATALIEGSMDKSLKKLLKKNVVDLGLGDQLAVTDKALGGVIKEKLGIQCVCNPSSQQLWRGIKGQLECLMDGLDSNSQQQMALGLSHTLNRFKLKFSPEKVDTMIIQAVGLLDDLDKELNNFAMRLREWYGWHFPELAKIVTDSYTFGKVVKALGFRSNAKALDLTEVVGDDQIAKEIKTAAEISMGVEITSEDLKHILELCDRVLELTEYRQTLAEYLKQRMTAIAPNLTYMVGELIGARLISHAGSLMGLAKHPASTLQILGAEKALFRALKTKQQTPKYGLIYHASMVGQCQPKNKGKISRVLAAKLSLTARVDALGETQAEGDEAITVGKDMKDYVEKKLRKMEGISAVHAANKAAASNPAGQEKYVKPPKAHAYDTNLDAVTAPKRAAPEDGAEDKKAKKQKVKVVEEELVEASEKKAKKEKKEKKEKTA